MTRRDASMMALLASLLCLTAAAATPSTVLTIPYPGSGHDFNMQITVNGVGTGVPCWAEVVAGDELGLLIESPGGTLSGAPYLVAAKSFVTGGLPFPGLDEHRHLPVETAEIVSDPSSSSSFGSPVVSESGSLVNIEIPPGLAGSSWMFQAFSTDIDGSVVATSDGYEVHIVN